MNDDTFYMEQCLTDVMLDIPAYFNVGDKEIYIYPVTLAKKRMLQRRVVQLGIDNEILKKNPHLEALRVAHERRDVCCEILAYHATPNTKADFHDRNGIESRKRFFEEMHEEDIATLLVAVLTSDNTEMLTEYLGLDKEREKMNRVTAIKRKHGKNNLVFGGKSILGTFIAQLREKGYTDDEIRFEHGYTYLTLMLADWITSIYMSDEELSEMPTDIGGTMLDGNNPASKAALKELFKQRGVKVD